MDACDRVSSKRGMLVPANRASEGRTTGPASGLPASPRPPASPESPASSVEPTPASPTPGSGSPSDPSPQAEASTEQRSNSGSRREEREEITRGFHPISLDDRKLFRRPVRAPAGSWLAPSPGGSQY